MIRSSHSASTQKEEDENDDVRHAFWTRNSCVRIADQKVRIFRECSQRDSQAPVANCEELRVATWNLLAPPYARIDTEKEQWRARLQAQQRALERVNADIAALQEFWCANEEAVELWAKWASDRGYELIILPRTRGKEDGCATLVRTMNCHTVEAFGLSYDDWGDRVCLVVKIAPDVLICNTHWTFAHNNNWDPIMRQHQARKLADYLLSLESKAVLVLGDLNGNQSDPALIHFAERGFKFYEPEALDWVSHYAHTKKFLACDFLSTSGPNLQAHKLTLHGHKDDLKPQASPQFRISDHLLLSATVTGLSYSNPILAPSTEDSGTKNAPSSS